MSAIIATIPMNTFHKLTPDSERACSTMATTSDIYICLYICTYIHLLGYNDLSMA
jgi:hypothetical protein